MGDYNRVSKGYLNPKLINSRTPNPKTLEP